MEPKLRVFLVVVGLMLAAGFIIGGMGASSLKMAEGNVILSPEMSREIDIEIKIGVALISLATSLMLLMGVLIAVVTGIHSVKNFFNRSHRT